MSEKENKKSIIKKLPKWIKKLPKWIVKLDTLLGSVRNIVLVIIACTLIVIAGNTDYFSGSVYVRGSYINVENFPSSINVDNFYEISR
jgi:hypothetical protein